MAENNTFDCAETDLLLCNEETKGLCFDDGGPLESFNDQNHEKNEGKNRVSFGYGGSDSDPLIVLPCPSGECIGWMVGREREHLPRDDYLERLRSGELDMSLRREALDWMFKACTHHNFGEFCWYLATNYLDRFLSMYTLPVGKTWAIQLVAVACLSLAAKMDEVNVPSAVDLQAGEPKYLFEAKTIQRMEVLVLNYLKWNMKPYTPLNFIEYFFRKTNDDQFPPANLIARSTQIILNSIKGIDFLEFKPSEIGAAVAVYVSGEKEAMDIDKALSNFIVVEKDRVVKCLELIRDLISRSGNANPLVLSSTVPHSPNGVLDAAACLSYKSDETAVGSCPTSSHSSPEAKRRKLDKSEDLRGGS